MRTCSIARVCLNWSQVCDGLADCKDGSDEDGSDEDGTLCTAFECPPPAFRCFYGACVSPNAMCNHIPDCLDGSDEMPEICLAKNPSVRPLGQDIKNAWKTVVHSSCRNGYALIGEDKNICDQDQWRYPLARCVPQCKHVANLRHARQCTLNGRLIDCDQSVLPMSTQMSVTCSSGYEKTGGDGLQFCDETGSWRGHKPEFTLVCHATIVSPYILIAPEICFRNVAIKSVASTEPVLYTVAEGGSYGNSFLAHEPHPYKLHNVSYIHYVRVSDGKNVGTLVLMHLVQPLEFHVKLRPVCLTEEVTDNWITAGDFNGVYTSQAIINDERQPDRYELKEIFIDASKKYHIGVFKQAIQNEIAETQAKDNI
ncbi:GM10948 [Drosophila sechellia]|uniref:GM10948 n=1 Tax=Drosophila sechellia TaxID=7238 RepID=B4I4R9_DROSE|nr:GM10948 [Drosophila sechellia]